MKLKHLLFFLFSAAILFSSCEKDDEKIDTAWKEGNEAAFAKIAANAGYTKLESQSKNGYIMYKVLQEGTGDKSPLFSSQVKAYYQGWYKRNWLKEDNFVDENGVNKKVFDSSLVTPATFLVSGVVDGFATALQHMVVGDKWEIWIPWKLGYGSSTSSNSPIPAYTTLVFEIELSEIVK